MTAKRTLLLSYVLTVILLAACSPAVREEEAQPVTPDPVNTVVLPTATPIPKSITTDNIEPTLALDSIWDEMPLLPTPAPLPTSAVPTPDPELSNRFFPNGKPEGVVLPTPGAVWQAGHLNGLPRGVDSPFPASEYTSERNFAQSVHLHDPNQLPAFLETGQSLVIHLPTLPPDLYVFYVATTGGTEEEGKGVPGFYSRESYRRRFLRIRFNDRIVWQRTVPPFHALTKAALDPTRLHVDGNTLVLENLGTHPIPLDAVWIAPHRLDDRPMYVALDQGEWLNQEDSGWVQTVVVHADGSPSSTPKGDTPHIRPNPVLPEETLVPIPFAGDLPAAWRRVGLRFRLLEEQGYPDIELLRAWAVPLREAVYRGSFPLLQLETLPENPNTLEAAAYLYGEIVQTWILPGHSTSEIFSQILRQRIPAAKILYSTAFSSALEFPTIRSKQYWWGFDLSVSDGRRSTRIFAGSTLPAQLPSAGNTVLSPHFSWLEAFKPVWTGERAGWATNSVAEWMMRRETPVILRGGYPGGPFFPDGSDRAGDLWWWMKPLTRFGSPAHKPGVANIVAYGPDTNPVLLHWAVADNGSDSVQVLAHTPAAAASIKGTIELPVPWTGPTRMIHHATTFDWTSRPKEERDSHQFTAEATEIENPGDSKARGWVRHDFRMRGMHLFELYPVEGRNDREIHAPEEVGFKHIQETRELFNPSSEPPPSWWSRKEMGEKFSHLWRPSGAVNLQVKVDATRDGAPGWDTLKGVHQLIPKTFSGVSPLSDKSTRFQFREAIPGEPQVMRMFFKERIAPKADAVGLWIRAHRPAGFEREIDPFQANPIARFYLGKLPQRQLIEIEYDRWHFISSPARYWAESSTNFPPALMFWPSEKETFQPVLEVNSFAAYRLSLEEGVDTPGKTLGFVREREDGSQALLIIGLPDRPAFWSQRLENIIDPKTVQHVEDAPRVVSAESPEDPPPEEVRHDMEWIEESRLLEVHIPRMPPPPTNWYKQRILDDFPLIGWMMQNSELSAVLFNEVRETGRKSP